MKLQKKNDKYYNLNLPKETLDEIGWEKGDVINPSVQGDDILLQNLTKRKKGETVGKRAKN